MLVNLPLNITVPLPSAPETVLPVTLIAEPLYAALGSPTTNSGVASANANVAVLPDAQGSRSPSPDSRRAPRT